MKKLYVFLWLLLFCGQLSGQNKGMKPVEKQSPTGIGRRLALLIGNKDYQSSNLPDLTNPINDVTSMSAVLKKLGFEVIIEKNATQQTFRLALLKFRQLLRANDVGLVYYSGHGMSYNGQSYLMPIDAQVNCVEEIEAYGIGLRQILTDMKYLQLQNSIVILDACRNQDLNACTNQGKGMINKGFVAPQNPSGSIVIYATEEGSVAQDTPDLPNGLFTYELLKYLGLPNVGLREILDKAFDGVEAYSQGKQSPARYDKLKGDFYFLVGNTPKPKTDPYEPEMVFVEGGSFDMGSNDGGSDEKPVHRVTLGDYYIGKSEVTQAQWEAVMGNNPSDFKGCAKCPVENVSWDDVQIYLGKLNKKTDKTYRLPTEAEWEYAARGGKDSKGYVYAGSNDDKSVGWNFSW